MGIQNCLFSKAVFNSAVEGGGGGGEGDISLNWLFQVLFAPLLLFVTAAEQWCRARVFYLPTFVKVDKYYEHCYVCQFRVFSGNARSVIACSGYIPASLFTEC